MPAILRSRRLPLFLAACAVAGGLAWRHAQGPELPGYRLESRPLVQRVVASGEVDSQSIARIGSEITGVVASRPVREGDAVRTGDVLLTLRDAEPQARVREAEAALAQLIRASRPQAEAAVRETLANLEQARREQVRRDTLFARGLLPAEAKEQAARAEVAARVAHERARLTAETLAAGGSEEQVLRQRLEAARVALARTRLLAPVDGIVRSRAVEPGDLVQPGRTLLEITRTGSREILLPLDEKSLAPVHPGQPATVIADAWPQRPVAARVGYLAPAVDTTRGTLDVHLELLEPADFLLQGMTVSVSIETGRREQALVLPNDALHGRAGDRAEVLRLDGDRVRRVPVRLGLRGTAQTEVLEGLAAGDRVLATVADEGVRVRLREQPMPSGNGE